MTEGMEFDVSSRYQTGDDGLTKVPYTYSAWIYLPKSTIDRGGVIFGNYKDNSTPSFSMEIYSNGVPRFYQLDSNKKTTSFTFPNADVRTGDWAHLVFTVTDVVTCYLNGKNVGESAVFAYDEIPFVFPFCIGGDLRSGNAQYFKGRIREIALFSEVLTASKVETLYKEGAAAVGKELIAYYDLSNVKANEDIKDTTGNGNTVFCDPRFFAEKAPVGEYAYSFAFVGDTQIVTEKYPNELSKIYDWILANKDAKKIAYVLGLGDITNSDTDQEWATALSQISKLDGKLPYSLVRGNHDSVKQFTKNFSTEVYRKQFEGFYEDGILNTWRTFKAGKTDYLMITLDYGASDDVLKWAGEVIAAHPEHRVIITTHAYFFRDGTTLGANDVCPPATTGGSNNGDDIWKKLISKYENIVLVVSGHDPCENIVARQAKGEHGNTVTQVLIDPQGVDAASGATGMVAMFYFSEDGNSIEVECYSTVREKFFLAENQFKINIPQTEKKPETTKAPETTSAPETTAAPADTDAPAVTTAPTTTPAPAVKDGSSPVGIIIAVAAVVVIAVVVGVILVKKKKA
ncbi:MAG: metallophosphoesterase [Clostridia bacterium]|nr:metallophosphoesterase [Clostridia bacterium]